MAAIVQTRTFSETEDFAVESPDGMIGRVEEIWLGPAGEPRALALRTRDGRRALLLDEDVLAVDRERHRVVVGRPPELMELDAPRLDSTRSGGLAATWSTTGEVVRPAPRPPLPRLRIALP
jgi:hypothetical protein